MPTPATQTPCSPIPRQHLELVEGELISKTGEHRPHVICARAGIMEYWVLDVAARRLISHRELGAGRYQCTTIFNAGESICPLAAPANAFLVA